MLKGLLNQIKNEAHNQSMAIKENSTGKHAHLYFHSFYLWTPFYDLYSLAEKSVLMFLIDVCITCVVLGEYIHLPQMGPSCRCTNIRPVMQLTT